MKFTKVEKKPSKVRYIEPGDDPDAEDESADLGRGPELLARAEDAVFGRMEVYGHPKVTQSTTAIMWSAYLSKRLGIPVELDVQDVDDMQILLKITRNASPEKCRSFDTLVDYVGYALVSATAWEDDNGESAVDNAADVSAARSGGDDE